MAATVALEVDAELARRGEAAAAQREEHRRLQFEREARHVPGVSHTTGEAGLI